MINPSQSNFVGEKNIQTVLRAGESNRTWRIHRNFIFADTCDSQQDSSPTAQSDFWVRKTNPVTLTINCGASRHHNPRAKGPSNFRTLRTFGAKPRQPSLRTRRVRNYFIFTVNTKAILPSLYSTVRGMERRAESSRAMERPMPKPDFLLLWDSSFR